MNYLQVAQLDLINTKIYAKQDLSLMKTKGLLSKLTALHTEQTLSLSLLCRKMTDSRKIEVY